MQRTAPSDYLHTLPHIANRRMNVWRCACCASCFPELRLNRTPLTPFLSNAPFFSSLNYHVAIDCHFDKSVFNDLNRFLIRFNKMPVNKMSNGWRLRLRVSCLFFSLKRLQKQMRFCCFKQRKDLSPNNKIKCLHIRNAVLMFSKHDRLKALGNILHGIGFRSFIQFNSIKFNYNNIFCSFAPWFKKSPHTQAYFFSFVWLSFIFLCPKKQIRA